MNRLFLPAFLLFIILIAVWGYGFIQPSSSIISPVSQKQNERILDRYRYDRMRSTIFSPGPIQIGEIQEARAQSKSRYFHFEYEEKKVSGIITLPVKKGTYPVIILIRGYVDQAIYLPGTGSKHIGELLAESGFITLAPDFLGYGSSDKPSSLPLEERFQTYGSVLSLIASMPNINTALHQVEEGISVNQDKIGLWGHSNGGQIAISLLEISGKPYPTVLWAPVSKPFPYSILYYTDEFEDYGKALRKVVADFEREYDSDLYSLHSFYAWITAPIQVHQGTKDDAVPLVWSDQLVESLEKQNIDVTYFIYPGEDHNFSGGGWETVAGRSVLFFKKYLPQ